MDDLGTAGSCFSQLPAVVSIYNGFPCPAGWEVIRSLDVVGFFCGEIRQSENTRSVDGEQRKMLPLYMEKMEKRRPQLETIGNNDHPAYDVDKPQQGIGNRVFEKNRQSCDAQKPKAGS